MSNESKTECITNLNLSVYPNGSYFLTECITNMKLFLKTIKNKSNASKCKIQCLIECQTKVKLNE